MKIYQNTGINDCRDVHFPAGTFGQLYTIESAEVVANGYGDRGVLKMSFREKGRNGNGHCFGYGLIGEEIYKEFMRDVGAESVDELVAKDILAFIPPDGNFVRGLAIRR